MFSVDDCSTVNHAAGSRIVIDPLVLEVGPPFGESSGRGIHVIPAAVNAMLSVLHFARVLIVIDPFIGLTKVYEIMSHCAGVGVEIVPAAV